MNLFFHVFGLTLLQVEKGYIFPGDKEVSVKNIIPKITLIIMFRTITITRKHLLGFFHKHTLQLLRVRYLI